MIAFWKSGSSPLTRGARLPCLLVPVELGIIPAYAGSTPAMSPCPRRTWDHPRLRGEHSFPEKVTTVRTGSSPLTRGARSGPHCSQDLSGIIPAYAGSTKAPSTYVSFFVGSSPLTRGALLCLAVRSRPLRIIPAYAGSTLAFTWALSGTGDHPRLRGEHPSFSFFSSSPQGSSPLTRGAL